MTISQIRDEISALADPKNAEFFAKLNPTAKPCAGVRIPALRKLAQKIAKDDYRAFLDTNPMDTFEMEALQAFVIGYAKDDINVILSYLDKFIPKVHDWSVADSLCQTFKIAKKYPDETFAILTKYRTSHKEFEVLRTFLFNPSMTVTKDLLISTVWGMDSEATDNNVEVYISFIRKKLKHLGTDVQIETVRGVGYRLVENG